MSLSHERRQNHEHPQQALADDGAGHDHSDPQQRKSYLSAVQQRAAGPLPQPDLAADGQMAMHKGDHAVQRKAPTAGPSEDDRFGEGPVANDAHGRIIGVSIVGGRTRLMIGLGHKQGVHVGMEGYVRAGDDMLADFQIEAVNDRVCYASVDVTPDGLHGHDQVVINPSSKPASSAPQHDMKARVVGISVEGNQTKLMIGRGVRHGARAGMRGYLVGQNGRPAAVFEVVEQYSSHVVAYVHEIPDQVRQHTDVVLNPSSMP